MNIEYGKGMVIYMTREGFLRDLIKKRGFSLKSFARQIDMPYTTLLTILTEGRIGSASIDNVIKICGGLGITVDELLKVESPNAKPTEEPLVLSPLEKALIKSYRQHEARQSAIKLLAFAEEPNYDTDQDK